MGSGIVLAQGIVNTEKMLSDADKTLTINLDVSGDISLGNILLYRINTQVSAGIRRGPHLARTLYGYDYLNSDGTVKSSDLFNQWRYNYYINRHSLYAFYQIQNAKSLKLKNRQLVGGGFRYNLIKKEADYLDVALGGFYESEIYNQAESSGGRFVMQHVRGNANVFSSLQITENTRWLNTFYFQHSLKNEGDYRLYLESKVTYDLGKADFNVMFRNRYHSAPYISGIDKADQKILFGFSFDL